MGRWLVGRVCWICLDFQNALQCSAEITEGKVLFDVWGNIF